MTFNQAIELLKLGDEDAAWKIAKVDSGLCIDTTKEAWLKYAKQAILNRSHEERAYKRFLNKQ